jgi:hypothetical protein
MTMRLGSDTNIEVKLVEITLFLSSDEMVWRVRGSVF